MRDPYAEPLPYEVLGLKPEASATEIRDRFNKLQRDMLENSLSVGERSKCKQELEAAYNQLRVAAQRVKVDFWLLDPRIGRKQCENLAQSLATPNTSVAGLVKPRTIRVTHATVLPELSRLAREPARVAGLHPQAIEVGEVEPLPAALEPQFDS
jgi:hypothetical protein